MRAKLEFGLCIGIIICFVLTVAALMGLSFVGEASKPTIGMVVFAGLGGALACLVVLVACLFLDATSNQS